MIFCYSKYITNMDPVLQLGFLESPLLPLSYLKCESALGEFALSSPSCGVVLVKSE